MINYFNFKKIRDGVLITNDIGHYAILSYDEFALFIQERLNKSHNKYSELVAKRFILEGNKFISSGYAADDLQAFRGYLRSSTGLHIFVLTNKCNMHCRYCQAQSEKSNVYGAMTKEIAQKAVDIALQAPDEVLTFEMQGGEPLLNYEVLKFIIEYAETKKQGKRILYSITTNGTLLTEDIILFFEKYSVSVSISLDGPAELQQYNRPMNNGKNSFDYIQRIIPELKKHNIFGGAVLTTTNQSLGYWREIIDTYLKFGIKEIFIRPLTPLGFANDHWDQVGYNISEFLVFYREIMGYILDMNRNGVFIRELHAMIFLRKIMCQMSDNYMELRSPCGATIGQVAYYYDGNIYTCDEGRMIAQMGDNSFCLGNVETHSYYDVVNCGSCKAVCRASILEALPGCSECAYLPYCGTCPATTYALENSLFSRTNNNYRCRTYKGILDILFECLLEENNEEIFRSWL